MTKTPIKREDVRVGDLIRVEDLPNYSDDYAYEYRVRASLWTPTMGTLYLLDRPGPKEPEALLSVVRGVGPISRRDVVAIKTSRGWRVVYDDGSSEIACFTWKSLLGNYDIETEA